MIVSVRLFARARDLAEQDSLRVELSAPSTVGHLRERLAAACPALAAFLPRCAVAIDEEFAEDTAVIRPDSVIVILPPVSGG
jgi:molybdopterin converting factor subunit 1